MPGFPPEAVIDWNYKDLLQWVLFMNFVVLKSAVFVWFGPLLGKDPGNAVLEDAAASFILQTTNTFV